MSDVRGAPATASQPWPELSAHYERARAKEDSFDRILEWPVQQQMLGDVSGLSLLDVGCGNGDKLRQLMAAGAREAVGIDISGNFIEERPEGLQLIQGDLNDWDSVGELHGRTFDRILFLQSFGYAKDPVRTLQAARSHLADDGVILLTRTHPIRYAVERTEQNGTTLGEEYFSDADYSYASGWNQQITLTKHAYTVSDLLNTFSAAGLWIERAEEPQLPEEMRQRYPHKQEWLNKYLGVFVFRLRPLPRGAARG